MPRAKEKALATPSAMKEPAISRRELFTAALNSLRRPLRKNNRRKRDGEFAKLSRKEWIAIAVLSARKSADGTNLCLSGMTPKEVLRMFQEELDSEGKIALSLLDIGRQPDGKRLNLRALNEDGLKGLVELFDEIQCGEARIRIYDFKTGLVIRRAFSLELEIRVGDYIFVELVRNYKGKAPEERKKNLTETGQKGEKLKKTFFRILLHEVGIHKTEEEIDEIFKQMYLQVHTDLHQSKAYKGILSDVRVLKAVFRLPERPKEIEHGKEIKDTSVVIEAGWVYSPETQQAEPDLKIKTDPFLTHIWKNLHKAFKLDLEPLPDIKNTRQS